MHTDPRPSSVIDAVGLDRRPVAGHRPAPAVERAERAGRLVGVLVVADRDRTADGEQTPLPRARHDGDDRPR